MWGRRCSDDLVFPLTPTFSSTQSAESSRAMKGNKLLTDISRRPVNEIKFPGTVGDRLMETRFSAYKRAF